MNENKKITRAASVVSAATFLSRIFGFIRDMVIAYFFGVGMFADAFFVAFRIPNLLRRLVAEGTLTVSFIPVFTEYLTVKSKEEAFRLARIIMTILSISLVVLSVAGILAAPWIVRIFAPGFYGEPDKFALTVLLTRIVFPYIFFISLVALAMGILNALEHFAAPALAPVFLNLSMIVCTLVLSQFFDPPILALAVGVILGGILQLVLQIPFLLRKGFSFKPALDLKEPGIARIGLLMAPAALGAAVYQFSIFISTLLASFLPPGSISALYYADRLVQFPLGVFAVALSSAVLPSMSRQAAANDMSGLSDTVSYSVRLVFFISLPAMVGLMVLAKPIVHLLFERGLFDRQASNITSQALVAYALGLWAFSGIQILVRVFYSLKDTKTPVKIAVLSLLANIVLAILLMQPFKHVGLALATSISSMINLGLLAVVLKGRLRDLEYSSIYTSLLKSLLAALFMGLAVFVLKILFYKTQMDLLSLAGFVTSAIVVGTLVFTLCAWILGADEIKFLRDIFKKAKPSA